MHISCPACQAVYRIDKVDADAILVCHHCGHEFTLAGAASRGDAQVAGTEPVSPGRRQTRIWPWLLLILLILAGAGLGMNGREIWADPWLRSVLINFGLPLSVRNEDWQVDGNSLSGRWLKRDDDSQVFVIKGIVRNLLHCELPPPQLTVSFFSADGNLLLQRTLPITQPPLMQAVVSAPYLAPPQDTLAVAAGSSRAFTLVLEDVPDNAVKFTLSAVATSP